MSIHLVPFLFISIHVYNLNRWLNRVQVVVSLSDEYKAAEGEDYIKWGLMGDDLEVPSAAADRRVP